MKRALLLLLLAAGSLLALPQRSIAGDPAFAPQSSERGIIVVNTVPARAHGVLINGKRAEGAGLMVLEGRLWTERRTVHIEGKVLRANAVMFSVDSLDNFSMRVTIQDVAKALNGGRSAPAIMIGSGDEVSASTGGDDTPVETLTLRAGSLRFRSPVSGADLFLAQRETRSSSTPFMAVGIIEGSSGSVRMTEARTAAGDRTARRMASVLRGDDGQPGVLLVTGSVGMAVDDWYQIAGGEIYTAGDRGVVPLSR
jgi:hypothetical protein